MFKRIFEKLKAATDRRTRVPSIVPVADDYSHKRMRMPTAKRKAHRSLRDARNYRKARNAQAVRDIYARGADLIPADYLICHQEADVVTKSKVLAAAEQRRARRAARRFA